MWSLLHYSLIYNIGLNRQESKHIQWGMLQRTNATTNIFINKIRMLQRTNATTNIFINKVRMLQRTNATTNIFINKIRMLQRTNATTNIFINKIRMLQRTQRNAIGRRNTRMPMTCRAFPL